MNWDWTRATVDPNRSELVDGAALFSVEGRSTYSMFAEFVGDFPEMVPESWAYGVTLEALTSKADEWRLITWRFEAGKLRHPGNYIMYANDRGYLRAEGRAEAADNLQALRA